MTVVDAAAFRKPVIGLAETPAVAEIIADGETGMLCGSTVAAYADGLARLMRDAEVRRRLGDAARRQFASAYSREAFLDRWEAALRDVCGDDGLRFKAP